MKPAKPHVRHSSCLLAAFALWLLPQAPAAAREPIHQLRIYEIFEANKEAFHERFRDHAMRIMGTYGFHILAMWETRSAERTEFVYLLEWRDEATMKERWAKFMTDEEWAAIKERTAQRHGQLVGEIEDRTLRLTDGSPRGLSRESVGQPAR